LVGSVVNHAAASLYTISLGGHAMRFRLFGALGALVLMTAVLCTGSFAAPTIESTPVPAPAKPDWSGMKFMTGTWSCSTKSARRPAAYITTVVTTMDPSGYWMISKSSTAKTSWAPAASQTDWYTWDPDAHRWVDVTVGDFGGYDTQTSPGWKGSSIVWTDALFVATKDVSAASPVTIMKVSDTKMTGHSTFTEGGTGRVVTVDTTCTKSG
jgi:hypothetical protein